MSGSLRTHCPSCGAPIDYHAEKCAYCDTPYSHYHEGVRIIQTADAITVETIVTAVRNNQITPNAARRALGLEEVVV